MFKKPTTTQPLSPTPVQLCRMTVPGLRQRLRWLAPILAACGMLASTAALAQASFPSKPLRIVVGFGAGGVADIAARIVAQGLGQELGKPVVVENLPGAGGINAAMAVAKAKPDGHTLLLVSNQNAVSPSLFKTLPYRPLEDFAMISPIGSFDLVMVVDKASKLKTVSEAIAQARKDPAGFNIGTVGVGSTQNLAAQLFVAMAGLEAQVVPFRSSGDVVSALRGGNVQAGFETMPAVLPQIQSGTLRPLAVTGSKRFASLPGTPTMSETGLTSYQATSWNGLAAPAKTPVEVVTRLNQALAKVVQSPASAKKLADLGLEPRSSTPQAFQAFVAGEIRKWHDVIERARIEKQ
ncbi:Bug family tripartite tricarboxylate transporter substrate binding protein [Cupriavidus necator]